MMLPAALQQRRRITLHPGEYQISAEPIVFTTLLGSCVAICLYDPVARIFGMNHFLLAIPHATASPQGLLSSEAGRYGIHAMELLINALLRRGAQRQRLQAKGFGGANVLAYSAATPPHPLQQIGDVNSRFATTFLAHEGIPLIASSFGGRHGRVIHFDGSDFSVYQRHISADRDREIAVAEQQLWRRQLTTQSAATTQRTRLTIW